MCFSYFVCYSWTKMDGSREIPMNALPERVALSPAPKGMAEKENTPAKAVGQRRSSIGARTPGRTPTSVRIFVPETLKGAGE